MKMRKTDEYELRKMKLDELRELIEEEDVRMGFKEELWVELARELMHRLLIGYREESKAEPKRDEED